MSETKQLKIMTGIVYGSAAAIAISFILFLVNDRPKLTSGTVTIHEPSKGTTVTLPASTDAGAPQGTESQGIAVPATR